MSDQENVYSVGIDIGTSTTQCIFSSMRLINQAPAFAVPRIALTDKRVLFRAPLRLTPLSSFDTIDADAIRDMVAEDYRAAQILPEQISAGAVIITGETARKQNARAVTQALSQFAGDFVVATAGAALEGILAGKGSGAAALSSELRKQVLNIDIGGGTSNFCLFSKGEPIETGCVDIGGRLLRRHPIEKTVISFSAQMARIAEDAGLFLKVGDSLSDAAMVTLAQRMSNLLEEAAALREPSSLYEALLVEHGLPAGIRPDIYTFSGGVANCIYETPVNPLFSDDLGSYLGKALQESRFFTQGRVFKPKETQHATVIGAGVYSMSLSGSTILYDGISFPLLGLSAGKIILESPEDIPALSEQVAKQYGIFQDSIAICFEGWKNPSYVQIEAIAEALHRGIPSEESCPVIVSAQDMGKALGQALQRLRGQNRPLLCMDNVSLSHGDILDIGVPLSNGRVLPVVVKTLAFPS